MNRYLSEAVQKDVRNRWRHTDDDELIGKTVAKSVFSSFAGFLFTDGTWCGVTAYMCDYDDADISDVDGVLLSLEDLRDLGVITVAQYQEARREEAAANRAVKQQELERLQKELGSGKQS